MAIYHFSVQVASRSAGRSAVAMAAYRSGDRLTDERTGETKSYRRNEKPETMILAPAQSPQWVQDRGRLWNEVEKAEKRKDAQLCREINAALPKEFAPQLQEKMLRAYCQREFVDRGMVADVAIHRNDPNNPHAHIMLTMREIGPEGFGQKVRNWNDRELLESWREAWAQDVNRIFEKAQRPQRIDHRSFERQGETDRLPTIHEGPTVRQMEQRGVITDRGNINRSVHTHNAMVIDLRSYAQERDRIMKEQQPVLPKTMNEIQMDQKHSQLYWQRHNLSAQIEQLQQKLQQMETVKALEKERDVLRKQQEELHPKNLWERMTKPNQSRIDQLEREIQRVEKQLTSERRGTPPEAEKPQIEKDLSVLQGTFKAIDRAFKALDQERKQLQHQEFKRKMKDMAKIREKDRDRGWER